MSDWIPTYGQPLGYVEVGGKRYPVKIDTTWFRAFTTAFNRLGIDGKTVGAVDAAAQTTAAQTTANAAALAATVVVLQDNAIPGAEDIPPIDTGTPLP